MISRILEQEPAIRQVLGSDRKSTHLIPTWQDLEVLEAINKALDPLSDFTDIMSGENYVTVSSVKPLLHHLKTNECLQGESDTQLTKDIKKAVMTYLETKYEDSATSELITLACVLDPRFKVDYVDKYDLEGIKEVIMIEGIAVADKTRSTTTTTPTDPQLADPEPEARPPTKKLKLGSLFKKARVDSHGPPMTPRERAKAELASYLQSPQPDSDVKWWQSREDFPTLSTLARKYLCVCATSSASERLFINVVTSKRSCLKPDIVNMLVFLSQNL